MRTVHIIGVLVATLVFTATASAQVNFNQQTRNNRYRQGTIRNPNTYIINRPTVSPYLALADLEGFGIDGSQNYFTMVRPRLERDEQMRRQQLELQSIQANVADMRSLAARRAQCRGRMTGHPTRFQTYLQYFPGFNTR